MALTSAAVYFRPRWAALQTMAHTDAFFPKLPLPAAARTKGTNTPELCLCELQLHSPPCDPPEVQPRILGTSWSAVWKVLGMEAEGDHRLQVSGKNVFRSRLCHGQIASLGKTVCLCVSFLHWCCGIHLG